MASREAPISSSTSPLSPGAAVTAVTHLTPGHHSPARNHMTSLCKLYAQKTAKHQRTSRRLSRIPQTGLSEDKVEDPSGHQGVSQQHRHSHCQCPHRRSWPVHGAHLFRHHGHHQLPLYQREVADRAFPSVFTFDIPPNTLWTNIMVYCVLVNVPRCRCFSCPHFWCIPPGNGSNSRVPEST